MLSPPVCAGILASPVQCSSRTTYPSVLSGCIIISLLLLEGGSTQPMLYSIPAVKLVKDSTGHSVSYTAVSGGNPLAKHTGIWYPVAWHSSQLGSRDR